tara:strand:+ start:5626 stop:5811 length:186 start_codon:yes stop_codon:yes gene_type:complete
MGRRIKVKFIKDYSYILLVVRMNRKERDELIEQDIKDKNSTLYGLTKEDVKRLCNRLKYAW